MSLWKACISFAAELSFEAGEVEPLSFSSTFCWSRWFVLVTWLTLPLSWAISSLTLWWERFLASAAGHVADQCLKSWTGHMNGASHMAQCLTPGWADGWFNQRMDYNTWSCTNLHILCTSWYVFDISCQGSAFFPSSHPFAAASAAVWSDGPAAQFCELGSPHLFVDNTVFSSPWQT